MKSLRPISGLKRWRITTHLYDNARRAVSVMDPMGAVRQTAYWANGSVKAAIDALGFITTYFYDKAVRQEKIVDPHDEHRLFTYFADGSLETETKPGPRVTAYAYDRNQRQAAVVDSLGRTSTTVYNGVQSIRFNSVRRG